MTETERTDNAVYDRHADPNMSHDADMASGVLRTLVASLALEFVGALIWLLWRILR